LGVHQTEVKRGATKKEQDLRVSSTSVVRRWRGGWGRGFGERRGRTDGGQGGREGGGGGKGWAVLGRGEGGFLNF